MGGRWPRPHSLNLRTFKVCPKAPLAPPWSAGTSGFNVGNAHQYRCRHQDRGYFLPDFVTNLDGMVAELEDPYILLSEKKLADI